MPDMKKNIFTFLMVIIASWSYAQGNSYRKADKYFEQFQYAAAADAYEKIIHVDSSAFRAMERLAVCYNKLNDSEHAEKWLEKICSRPNVDPSTIKLYAQMLAENG